MKNKIFLYLIIILSTIALPTASVFAQDATTTIPSVGDFQAIIRQLQDQIKQLQEQIASLRGELETVKTELAITKTLKRGDTGDEVRKLQELLKSDPEIYPEGLVTGYFGPLTERAVRRFQEKHSQDILSPLGLSGGTGIVGENTIAKLNTLAGVPAVSAIPATPAQPFPGEGRPAIPAEPAIPAIPAQPATSTLPVATSTLPTPEPPPPTPTATTTESTATSTLPTPPPPPLPPSSPSTQYGSALDFSGVTNIFNKIWGPGSNGILLGGGLNFSTQVGVGWSQQYGGKFVTSYSIQTSYTQHYLTLTNPISVDVTGPSGSIIEVWDLESLSVVATNISNPGSPATFNAQPNRRYGGFAWYADNSQKDIAIFAKQSTTSPPPPPPSPTPTPTPPPPPPPPPSSATSTESTASNQVQGFTATVSGSSVTLSWQPVTTASIGVYYVYQSFSPNFTIGPSTSIARITQGKVSFTQTNVPGGTYYYKAAAEDINGTIYAPSQEVEVVVPSSCTGLSLTFANNKTSYIQGEALTFTWACIPSGTIAPRVFFKIDDVYYSSSNDNVGTQTHGFGTSNLSVGTHTLKACFDSNCLPSPIVTADFTINFSPDTSQSSTAATLNQMASILEATRTILNQLLEFLQKI